MDGKNQWKLSWAVIKWNLLPPVIIKHDSLEWIHTKRAPSNSDAVENVERGKKSEKWEVDTD